MAVRFNLLLPSMYSRIDVRAGHSRSKGSTVSSFSWQPLQIGVELTPNLQRCFRSWRCQIMIQVIPVQSDMSVRISQSLSRHIARVQFSFHGRVFHFPRWLIAEELTLPFFLLYRCWRCHDVVSVIWLQLCFWQRSWYSSIRHDTITNRLFTIRTARVRSVASACMTVNSHSQCVSFIEVEFVGEHSCSSCSCCL